MNIYYRFHATWKYGIEKVVSTQTVKLEQVERRLLPNALIHLYDHDGLTHFWGNANSFRHLCAYDQILSPVEFNMLMPGMMIYLVEHDVHLLLLGFTRWGGNPQATYWQRLPNPLRVQ